MATHWRFSIAVASMLSWALVTPVRAQEPAPEVAAATHVRPMSDAARDLLTAGRARSVTIRGLIDRLEASDLVVYVEVQWLRDIRTGRLALVGKAAGIRYAIIQVACGRITSDQLESLGHELRHAVEVADAADVVDRPSFAHHFATIGYETTESGPNRQFETAAAVDAGHHVRRQVATREAR